MKMLLSSLLGAAATFAMLYHWGRRSQNCPGSNNPDDANNDPGNLEGDASDHIAPDEPGEDLNNPE